jgi:hypothetical protein
MVKSCVFFAVRTEFLNIIQMSFGFKALMRDIFEEINQTYSGKINFST